ncbi:fluoride efflux transporter CrcB [Arthrobacter antioxidans]|uniref:fluoride efflux transporter CrcB n=1 Tax=Arthrobacter antioxidans TaxID=2895818 RepID=UPI001FFF948E|nr:fluoride efflux transporter CrcB [Arthrobacter antioxidans]
MSLAMALALGAAGGLGAVARFVLDGVIRGPLRGVVPIGTMTVNITGSFLLGLVTALGLTSVLPSEWTLICGVGFLGGYTTFSTASSETVRLLQAERVGAAVLSGAGTALAALAAAALGLWVGSLGAGLGGS